MNGVKQMPLNTPNAAIKSYIFANYGHEKGLTEIDIEDMTSDQLRMILKNHGYSKADFFADHTPEQVDQMASDWAYLMGTAEVEFVKR